jgi:hypothetical protein
MAKQGVTVDDIRYIETGSSMTFVVGHPKEIYSIVSMAYCLNSVEPDSGKKFFCKRSNKRLRVTVTANPL